MMKVVLLVPDLARSATFLQPPLCLCSIAANLPNEYEVTLIDNRVSKKAASDLASGLPADVDVIVVSTSPYDITQMYHFDYRLRYAIHTVNVLKATRPASHVVLVGAHATVFGESLLKETTADSVVIGEVERTVPDLLSTLRGDRGLGNIANILYRSEGGISATSTNEQLKHPEFHDFNNLPSWNLVDVKNYYGYQLDYDGRYTRLDGWAVMLASRGCPYSCSFCYNFWGKKVRYREPESIYQEFTSLSENPGLSRIFFLDQNFTLNREWCIEVCRLLAQAPRRVEWICQSRCDLLDCELLRKMAAVGCTGIQFGVESYNDEVLTRISKGITKADIETAVAFTKDAGIVPGCFLMIGLPGEDAHSVQNTISFLKRSGIPFIPILYSPRWGSEDAKRYFGEKESRHWEDLLPLRGKAAEGYETGRLISDFSKLRGESFRMTTANFDKTLKQSRAHHREHFQDMQVLQEGKDVTDYVVLCDDGALKCSPFISLPITGKCNLRCAYCGVGGENTICENGTNFNVDELIDFMLTAKRLGIRKVRITGGEPFLHPNLDDILRFLSDEKFNVLVNTNGTLVKNRIDFLMRPNRNLHFAVSLDTLNPNTFEILNRGPASQLDDALKGVRLLQELGLLMRINMVVTTMNVSEVEDIIAFCSELDCDLKLQEVASVPLPYGRWDEIHCSLNAVEERVRSISTKTIVHAYASHYGIPVPIYKIGKVHVTIKNIQRGGRYAKSAMCGECEHMPCHEGLYDMFVLNDSSIAPCRWKVLKGSPQDFEERLNRTMEIFSGARHYGGHVSLSPLRSWEQAHPKRVSIRS